MDYLKLRFQAIDCALDAVEPIGGEGPTWSPEVLDELERLSQ